MNLQLPSRVARLETIHHHRAMAASSHQSIVLYSELLSNIRQVSVAATLPSPHDSSTTAEVCDNGARLDLRHQGFSASLRLPARVAANGLVPLPPPKGSELSWRLPVSPAELDSAPFSAESQAISWTATDLKSASPVSCRQCSRVLVQPGTISTWKDLPSENWAEMMDFWHCHKPHDHDNEAQSSSKGYGASNAIAAQTGTGLVDIGSFMLSETDCNDLDVSDPVERSS